MQAGIRRDKGRWVMGEGRWEKGEGFEGFQRLQRLQGFWFEMFTCGELPVSCRRGFARLKGLKCSKSSCHAERSRSGFVMEERYNDVKGFHRGAQWITELHRGRKPKPTTLKITFARLQGNINCCLFSVYLCACSVVLCVTYNTVL